MYSLPTEPGSIGHTLDAGFKLYFVGFKRLIVLGILAVLSVIVPVFIAVFPFVLSMGSGQDPSAGMITMLGVAVVIGMGLYMWFYLAAMCRIGGIAYGQDLGLGACIGMGLRRLFPVFVASILYMLAMTLGYILLIIPGMIVWVTLAFFPLCIMLEGDGIIESLRHSHRLVWGNWWRTAVIGTVVLVIYYVISIAIEIPFIIIAEVLSDPEAGSGTKIVEMALSTTGRVLSAVVTFPLLVSVYVVVFHDLKLRKEGHDLEARVEALTAGA
jgi:hypothetical protein